MELPIRRSAIIALPGVDGIDAYRWTVELDDGSTLDVRITSAERTRIPLSNGAIGHGLDDALRHYASRRLDDDRPALEQIAAWDQPITLRLENYPPFRCD